ncbi:MAG TPA: glutamate--tRNA ligase [Actinomycetota bacterium]|nr:glutamate--tRNA ligase [Actinomycetota bacterium]
MSVRCRFAPAPSGSIHVGNVRTGLFSWAFARHHGGAFILRVEDTDASRVTEEAYHGVMESLRWLGIDWDEGPDVGGLHGPYRQSQRMDLYRDTIERLRTQGDAYPCYCTETELEERRVAAMARGEPPGYDGRCRTLTEEQRAAFEAEGRPAAIRFAMPDREHVVHDLVKGEVRWGPGQLRDFVLMRSDGTPVFLLAVAVDDLLMGVTHVIRGDDLLASAPRNAAVIEALGGTPPAYAHVPQVNGSDGKPLSKRHGSTSVEAFREHGILPEALMNYLALLGWSKDAETTFLSREELVAAFDLDRVSSNPARFDTQKLEWMNNHYIQRIDDDDLAARCLHFLSVAGLSPELALLRRAMPLVKERMKTLAESVELLRFLFTDDVVLNEKATDLLAKAPEGYLEAAIAALEGVEPWTAEAVAAALDEAAASAGLNRTKGWQPIRAAVTGSNVSPPLPESLELLGAERTIERLRAAS